MKAAPLLILTFAFRSVAASASCRVRGTRLFGRERRRRARRRCALRHKPKLEGVCLAVAPVDEAHAVGAQATYLGQVFYRALPHAVGLARAAATARVSEDVADRAGVV